MTTKVYVRKNGEAVIPASVLKSWGFEPGMEFEIDIRVPSDGKHAKFPPDIPPDKTVQDFLDEYEQKEHGFLKDAGFPALFPLACDAA